MTEEANKIVEGLRICSISSLKCEDCPVHVPKKSCQNDLDAADLIERLSSELELAKQDNVGLSIMLTAAQSAAETFKRERDALLVDLKEASKMDCSACKDYAPEDDWCEKMISFAGIAAGRTAPVGHAMKPPTGSGAG